MASEDWAAFSDEALMSRASRDDLTAFEQIVVRHQNRVYRMALHMLNSDEDAWDVSQAIFLKIYHARTTYTENAKFTTWLYRIANNAIIDRLRQIKRESRLQSLDDMIQEPESTLHSAQDNLTLGEVKAKMVQALQGLSERQRSMVIMKYYEGFSVKEISEVFDCADGTVKATLFQAIRNVRRRLEHLGVFDAEVLG